MAFRRGDDGVSAKVGALLIADGIYCLRRATAVLEAIAGVKRGN